jgi:hypothetical protein
MYMEHDMSVVVDQFPDDPLPNGISLDEFLERASFFGEIEYFNRAAENAAIATIQKADQTDFQAISATKLTLSNSFYNNALRQSQQSFHSALIFAGAGALFIIVSVTLVIVLQPTIARSVIIALLGGAGGVGASAISYATLRLYKQASEQAAACHICLDRTSDFILVNSACEGLSEPEKQQMRSEIIRKLFE